MSRLEWACEFGKVTSVGSSKWQVEAKCAGAGEYETRPIPTSKITVEETADKKQAAIRGAAFPSGGLFSRVATPPTKIS